MDWKNGTYVIDWDYIFVILCKNMFSFLSSENSD